MNGRTNLRERLLILELAEGGLSDREIAEKVGWSKATIRKWRRRGQQQGRTGLVTQMGRPSLGALSSFDSEVAERVRHWRTEHPGWGPTTLRTEFAMHAEFSRHKLPSRATIARFLKQERLTRSYRSHIPLLRTAARKADSPHAVWEMDAQGHEQIADVGVITAINLNDTFSRVRLLSFPCQVGTTHWERHPNMEDYQLALRLAFSQWGLPQQLQVDRASPFYDNHSSSPYPTRLHQWLVALGVSVRFSRCATDQAITERSHQLWQSQCLTRTKPYQNWSHLYGSLCMRQKVLNRHLPCRTLNGLPPLVAYPQAVHSGRPYRPEWEEQLLDLHRIYASLAPGRWFRRISSSGTFSLGDQTYPAGLPGAGRQIELSFDLDTQHFVGQLEDGQIVVRQPIRGLSTKLLMGAMATSFNLPAFQLMLPFDWHTVQVLRLCETMSGMTY